MSTSLEETEVSNRKKDLSKIKKYLIRQTGHGKGKREDSEQWNIFKDMTFEQFLNDVGMLDKDANTDDLLEIEKANQRYEAALSASVKGNGAIFMKRDPKDIFTNNFNPHIMQLHEANHDIQLVSDPYACAQYIYNYLTKAEGGMNKVLKAINDEGKD